MANVDLNLSALSSVVPSYAYIFLAALFSVLLLTLIRTAFLFATSPIQPPKSTTPDEKGQAQPAQEKPEPSQRQRRFFGLTWESLPLSLPPLALPVSLTVADNAMTGVGVGLAAAQSPRRGPAFETPRTPLVFFIQGFPPTNPRSPSNISNRTSHVHG
jgi:hypothetical protein